MDLRTTLGEVIGHGATEIFIEAGLPLSFRSGGKLQRLNQIRLGVPDAREFVDALYAAAGRRDMGRLLSRGDDDFAFSLEDLARFRVSAFRQCGALSAVVRVIPFLLPEPEALGVPEEVMALSALSHGLVLITGPAGSGKTKTLDLIVDRINQTREVHIVTLEDPVEFVHRPKRSIVSQREVGLDTESFVSGMRQALRQSADVVMVSELSGVEMAALLLKAAEGGRLVLSSLASPSAKRTVERILWAFSPGERAAVARRLTSVLSAVVSQRLVKEGETVRGEFDTVTEHAALEALVAEALAEEDRGV